MCFCHFKSRSKACQSVLGFMVTLEASARRRTRPWCTAKPRGMGPIKKEVAYQRLMRRWSWAVCYSYCGEDLIARVANVAFIWVTLWIQPRVWQNRTEPSTTMKASHQHHFPAFINSSFSFDLNVQPYHVLCRINARMKEDFVMFLRLAAISPARLS